MFAPLVVGLMLFSANVLGSAPTPSTSDARITPAPQIELLRKQNNDRYMGWVSWNGTWSNELCNLGGTYYQTSPYWRCCATTLNGCPKTNIPVGCISGSLIYQATASSGLGQSATLLTRACTSVFPPSNSQTFSICNTIFMFQNEQDSSPLTNVNCGASSVNWSYYRIAPVAATATSSSLASSTIASSPTTAGSTARLSTATATPTPEPVNGEEKKSSKAWIAGAIIGPLIGLALVGLAAFLFIRHKKNKQTQSEPTAGNALPAAYTQLPPPGPNSPPQYYPPMNQSAGAPGVVPYGVSKHESWAAPYSPSPGAVSPNPHNPGGALPPHQWQGQYNSYNNQTPPVGGQPGFGPPPPPMSPSPHVQPGQYTDDPTMYKHNSETIQPFKSELEGSYVHAQPGTTGTQPKQY